MTGAVLLAHFLAAALVVLAIIRLARDRPLPVPAAIALGLGLLALEVAGYLVSFPSVPSWDFTLCYYPAGQAALHYDIAALTALYQKVVQGFVNMPVVAYLFAPLALLDVGSASIAYATLGVGAAVASWAMLVRECRLADRERWLLATLFIANGPLLNGLKFGNTSHFILLALVGGFVLLRAGRSAAAGLLLGVAAVLKPALVLFGVFFLLRRDVRGTLAFGAAGATAAALSLALFGWDFNLFWFKTSILQFGHQWFSTFSVQSIPGFILRLHADADILTSWQPRTPTAAEQLAARVAIALLYVGAAVACLSATLCRERAAADEADLRRDLQYLLVICLAIVSSPLSWSHYYSWLLVPAAYFLGQQRSAMTRGPAAWVAWAAIALITPLLIWPPHFGNPALAAFYREVAVSNLLIGGLAWFGLVSWWLARSGRRESP